MFDGQPNGKSMAEVNLDALIQKEDFISDAKMEGHIGIKEIGIDRLFLDKDKYFTSIYHLLRKPDFQRETNEWTKEKICDLIDCFIKKSFIPTIIIWTNKDTNKTYVIDGAHRLSALIAYMNDDYGDGDISQKVYKYKIPPAIIKLAEETREYINNRIGSFDAVIKEGSVRSDILRTNTFLVQNIEGDVSIAEDSFFKINEQGVVISPTERELCKNRDKPTCIGTRVIMKGSAGDEYWKSFEENNKKIIKLLASELHTSLFEPPYDNETSSIVKDHPLGGDVNTAMPMVYNLLKGIKNRDVKGKEKDDKSDGTKTILYLQKVKKILNIMLSNKAGSIGFHPTIYFYDGVGNYIHSAFMGLFKLIEEKEGDTLFKIKLTVNRSRLEEFLIKNKIFLKQINAKKGSKERSSSHMKWFFENLINYLNDNESNEVVIKALKEKYDFLNENEKIVEDFHSRRFTQEVKSEKTILTELKSAVKCIICGGAVHPLSKDFDHYKDHSHGGKSNTENAEITHYYCNNSKNKLREIGFFKDA